MADQTISLRRTLHQNPELGFKEFKTSNLVSEFLEEYGVKVRRGLAVTGLVAEIEGQSGEANGMLRFDMDALPIHEETGLEFASKTSGVMHACGHDGHMAAGVSVARMLQEQHASLPGNVKCIFQPAEEGDGGAKKMIEEGVLKNPKPDFILGFHLWNEKPTGTICIKSGPLMAAGDTFEIRVSGKGGHGGLPQQTIDPIVCAAQIVTALQTIVSRNLSPFDQAVLSLGSIHGGTTFNVIPDEVKVKGTLRTFDKLIREKMLERMKEIIQGTATAMGCRGELTVSEIAPAVINDARIAQRVKAAVAGKYPELMIDESYQTSVSEDFGYYLEDVPGCYLLIGSGNAAKGKIYSHHHPRFDFDEDVLSLAAGILADCCIALLRESPID